MIGVVELRYVWILQIDKKKQGLKRGHVTPTKHTRGQKKKQTNGRAVSYLAISKQAQTNPSCLPVWSTTHIDDIFNKKREDFRLDLFSKLSLLSSVRPLPFPLSKHLWMQTCGQRQRRLQTWQEEESRVRRLWFARRTSLLQSKKSTNFTSAFPSISLVQPSRLSALRGKPSMRKRNFWPSFVMVSSMAWQTKPPPPKKQTFDQLSTAPSVAVNRRKRSKHTRTHTHKVHAPIQAVTPVRKISTGCPQEVSWWHNRITGVNDNLHLITLEDLTDQLHNLGEFFFRL